MKKSFFIVLLVFIAAATAMAQVKKYDILEQKKGPFGLGGKDVIMIDNETGKTWILSDNKWKVLPQVEEVAGEKPQIDEKAKAEQEAAAKAKLEEELSALKAKQDAELNAFKAKQDAELKSLQVKQPETNSVNPVSVSVPEPAKTEVKKVWRHYTTRSVPKKVKAAVTPAGNEEPAVESSGSSGGGEEAPPAWFKE